MNDSFGKFILGIATSVSLTAMTCLISKTTQYNKNSYDNDVLYTPPYRRIYFEKGQITTNEKVSPAYKEEIKYKIENKTVTGDVIKDEIYDSWFYT
jgi:hypothetical protein